VVIVCGGMPGSPTKKDVMQFFSKKGFWVFNPRYRGTWESDGKFLAKSPHLDILEVIDSLPKGFTDLWSNKKYKLKPDNLYIYGISFGGPAAILASLDKRVDKAVCVSPVIDWRVRAKDETIESLEKYVPTAFGRVYNTDKNGWKKLSSGKFYNPASVAKQIDGSKLLIIHAKDDRVVSYAPTKKFAVETGSKLITLPKGGHLRSMLLLKPRFYKAFQKHIKNAKVK
jgi:dipeptidyl aminopeptidase/acylaminoacyl peptidase